MAQGQAAIHSSMALSNCSKSAASNHKGGSSTPSKASGVTSTVTSGTASMLASTPAMENWPNISMARGVSASTTTHCWCRKARMACQTRARQWGAGGACSSPVMNSMATATKLSQNPGCSSAQGSSSVTAMAAIAQIACQGHCLPPPRSKATTSSMHTVRCAGTPQPANQA